MSGTGRNIIIPVTHYMTAARRAGSKNITSGTRRAVSNTKRREVSFFRTRKT